MHLLSILFNRLYAESGSFDVFFFLWKIKSVVSKIRKSTTIDIWIFDFMLTGKYLINSMAFYITARWARIGIPLSFWMCSNCLETLIMHILHTWTWICKQEQNGFTSNMFVFTAVPTRVRLSCFSCKPRIVFCQPVIIRFHFP